jgi:zinc transport system substrate-binding protein
MKKYVIFILTVLTVMLGLTGCQSDTSGQSLDDRVSGEQNGQKDKLQVIATIFPGYDWTREIIGDTRNIELTMLLDNGVDLHSYMPSAADMLKLSNCDVFLYVGGESDRWVEDALKEAANEDMKVINLLDILGEQVKEEEIVEGMDVKQEDSAKEEPEYDEHVWLSLNNAMLFCQSIADTLSEVDPENQDTYEKNCLEYNQKLTELDSKYQDAVAASEKKTLIFGDRFPFRYLTEDYGIPYYAAFAGCSAETEASFETITFLAGKLDELGLGNILTIDGSDQKIARTIVQSTKNRDQKILTLDSMQSVTSDESAAGTTYLSIMEDNLKVIEEAERS